VSKEYVFERYRFIPLNETMVEINRFRV